MAYNRDDPIERNERRQLYGAVGFFVLALVTLNLPGPAQQQLATILRGSLLRPFVGMQRMVTGARLRAVDNADLRARLDSLVTVLAQTGSLAEENRRLRGLLDLQGRLGSGFVAANAARSGTSGSESVLLIDVGRADGVDVNAPVLVQEGLVGKVIEVRSRESLAMDWTHPDFRASAMTEDGETYGIVEPDRGVFREADRLLLGGIPFYTELAEGTRVVTSGRGGIYPRGVAIGTVLELNEAGEQWRRSYWLRPAARPGRAAHVLVAAGPDSVSMDLSSMFSPPSPEGGDTEGDSTTTGSAPSDAGQAGRSPGDSTGAGR